MLYTIKYPTAILLRARSIGVWIDDALFGVYINIV